MPLPPARLLVFGLLLGATGCTDRTPDGPRLDGTLEPDATLEPDPTSAPE